MKKKLNKFDDYFSFYTGTLNNVIKSLDKDKIYEFAELIEKTIKKTKLYMYVEMEGLML